MVCAPRPNLVHPLVRGGWCDHRWRCLAHCSPLATMAGFACFCPCVHYGCMHHGDDSSDKDEIVCMSCDSPTAGCWSCVLCPSLIPSLFAVTGCADVGVAEEAPCHGCLWNLGCWKCIKATNAKIKMRKEKPAGAAGAPADAGVTLAPVSPPQVNLTIERGS